MAVIDKYANANVESGKLVPSVEVAGNKVVMAVTTFQIGTDDANSVYRVFPDLNPCLIPIDLKIYNSAATAGVVSVGLYEGNKGAVVDGDALASSVALGTAHGKAAPVDGLGSVAITDLGKKLYELAGHNLVTKKDTYDIALTVTTAATAVGNVTVVGTFIQG